MKGKSMSADNPAVSIIVPIYNVEKYIGRCVKSILNQTFKKYELLLVNDGSTDGSINVCRELVKDDARVKILNKVNGGLSDARNFGIDNSIGEYIIFIDSDDYVDKDFVKELYTSIKNNDAEVAICGFSEVDDSSRVLSRNKPASKEIISGRELLEYFYQPGGVVNEVIWNKIYRRDVFSEVRFATGKYYEDGFIIAPLYWNVDKVALIRKCLYFYVKRSGSIMNSSLSEKKLRDSDETYLYRMDFFKSRDDKLYMLAVNDYRTWIMEVTTQIYKDKKNKKFIEYLQSQFRKYYCVGRTKSLKNKVRDRLARINLVYLAKIKDMYNRTKR